MMFQWVKYQLLRHSCQDKIAITGFTSLSSRESKATNFTYLHVDVADLVDSSDYRSSDYRREYVSREIRAGVSTLDELQSETTLVPGIHGLPISTRITRRIFS